MHLSDELKILFKKKTIKDIIVFGSALFNQVESSVYTIRNFSDANINIFFRDEDINNLSLDTLSDFSKIKCNAYRLDLQSFSRIRRIKPQLVIILCDNPYNIGYRKAKIFSILCRPNITIFSNILNEVKYLSLKEFYKNRRKFTKTFVTVLIDSITAPLFYFGFIIYALVLKLVHKHKKT